NPSEIVELVAIEGCFADTAMESDIDARRFEHGNGEDEGGTVVKMGSDLKSRNEDRVEIDYGI
ncbi:hypothetical protein MKW92_002524, partial [Papaver armeniacum]